VGLKPTAVAEKEGGRERGRERGEREGGREREMQVKYLTQNGLF
jgi:hypothetical protein